MGTIAYLTLEGDQQGPISTGASGAESLLSAAQASHEDKISVMAFKHKVEIPRNELTGQPTGARLHKPFTITKVYDKSSPLLYNALRINENLTVTLEWMRVDDSGENVCYFKHVLTNAKICDIKAYMFNVQDPTKTQFTHLEDVSFSYSAIEWEHVAGNTNATDNWDS